MERKQAEELVVMIQKSFEAPLNTEEVQWLNDLLATSPEAVALYVETMATHTALRECKIDHASTADWLATSEIKFSESTESPCPVADFLTQEARHMGQGGDIESIRSRAERQLRVFLDEQDRLRRAQKQNSSTHEPRIIPLLQDIGLRTEKTLRLLVRSTVRIAAFIVIGLIVAGTLQHLRTKPVVATLQTTHQAQWQVPPTEALLRTGPMHLTQGFAELIFHSGARVLLEAPAQIVLETDNRLFLQQGSLVATIKDAHKGFIVNTPHALVEDLGTEFGVNVQQNGASETLVFDGLVRLQGQGPAQIVEEGQQIQASAQGRLSAPQALNPQHHFRRSWQEVHHLPRISGDIQLLREPPSSLLIDDLESSDHIFLFLERTGISLNTNDDSSNLLSVLQQTPSQPLETNQKVDSYFLHFDPVAPSQANVKSEELRCQAQIVFPRPIVGVVESTSGLVQSDTYCGHPDVTYRPNPSTFGLEKPDDYVIISPDRTTLTVVLMLKNYQDQTTIPKIRIDQLRILIESLP